MQKKKTTGLVWFKNNLRVRDNKALHEAVVQHEKVVGIYHLPKHWIEQTPWGFKKMERFRAQFLIETLTQLQKDLATRPTRQEIYGWIIAGISIATLITVLM